MSKITQATFNDRDTSLLDQLEMPMPGSKAFVWPLKTLSEERKKSCWIPEIEGKSNVSFSITYNSIGENKFAMEWRSGQTLLYRVELARRLVLPILSIMPRVSPRCYI